MLRWAIWIATLVPLSAGLAGALTGSAFLAEPAGPATDSHLRYLSGLLLGIGATFAWCAFDLRGRARIYDTLSAIVVTGGLARLLGLALAGTPPAPHLVALVMELGVVPALWLWRRRAFGR
jgi:hypothetical protein